MFCLPDVAISDETTEDLWGLADTGLSQDFENMPV
jgi:hypothetical protein